ncbi:MAG: diguanylate cyclase [Methylococcaceae bacterium]|nr:diguanylate cyclase [Methylococcaceae bacterium]
MKNSKRSDSPFSLIYISLTAFKDAHNLPAHEMDKTLRAVVDTLQQDIRIGIDLASRFGGQDFLLALSGVPLQKADKIAQTIQKDLFERVKTPCNLAVEVRYGLAEHSIRSPQFGARCPQISMNHRH